ncbi:hypothetical protein [Ruminiclostridium josui]|uniref:hypothetical protein n=1 Tax=Ruminiclostridium josui TaxID=1499 RepID=UPI0004AE4B28|nr:hypothetical protein [Ruminiclostridium josui]
MSELLLEDLQNEFSNYIEEAEMYRDLMLKHNLTQEELAVKIGKNQSTIANKVRLLKLTPTIKKFLINNNLTERHARTLLKLHDEQLQLKVLSVVCERELNIKKTEELVEKAKKQEDRKDFIKAIKEAIDTAKELGMSVKARQTDMDEHIQIVIHVSK